MSCFTAFKSDTLGFVSLNGAETALAIGVSALLVGGVIFGVEVYRRKSEKFGGQK